MSVHRARCKSDAHLWKIGALIAQGTREGTLHGQAEVLAYKFTEVQLEIQKDRWPTSHAEIVGWPRPATGDTKSAWMMIAEKLLLEPDPARLILPEKSAP